MIFLGDISTRDCGGCEKDRVHFNKAIEVCDECAERKLIYLGVAKLNDSGSSRMTVVCHGTLKDMHIRMEHALTGLMHLDAVKRMTIDESENIIGKGCGFYGSIGYWYKEKGELLKQSIMFSITTMEENHGITSWN